MYELLDRMSEVGARRLVIDSLNDLIVATPDPMRLREFLYSLVQRCARQGVSLMFTYETMELFRITRLSELGMSHIADNVVLLQHFQDGSDMKRALTVLKSTGLDELEPSSASSRSRSTASPSASQSTSELSAAERRKRLVVD